MTAGVDTPDRRGRTGLDRHGRDLNGNARVRIRDVELLSCDWYVLRKTTFDDPETAVRREAAEETGHAIGAVQHVFDVYMSPGSVTERLHCFAAPYEDALDDRPHGNAAEGEDITTVELPFAEALAMIRTGAIADAKTVMLLQWAALEGPFAA
jgi:nudix-type nucleoside diphosphatase (YffH/AdpP family)